MGSVLRESTDDSAPVLTGEAGSLINVLKKVLVEGYGTQAPLGWTVMFDNLIDRECVFRANSGTRFPVKINDNRAETGYTSSYATAYESMSDINTGYGPCPSPQDRNYGSIVKSTVSGATPIPWKIIGDDMGFWFLPKFLHAAFPNNPAYPFWEPHYIGDYTSLKINNRYNFVTLLHHSNSYGYFRSSGTPYGEVLWIMRDELTQEPGCVLISLATWHAGVGYLFGNNMSIFGVSPSDGKYLYESPILWNNSRPSGNLPGFYNMLWRSSGLLSSVSYFNMSSAEVIEFFEVQSDTQKMFIFPFREGSFNATTISHPVHRGSILIGEGFRNAN